MLTKSQKTGIITIKMGENMQFSQKVFLNGHALLKLGNFSTLLREGLKNNTIFIHILWLRGGEGRPM